MPAAHAFAKQLSLKAIEPEVLMLAVIRQANELVTFLLADMGVDKAEFGQKIAAAANALERDAQNSAWGLSPAAEKVLKEAGHAASRMGDNLVAVEHIFLALWSVESGVSQVMHAFGIEREKITGAIDTFRQAQAPPPQSEATQRTLPFLDKYARNLCKMAREGHLEPVIGREEEIRRVLHILARKTKNNPLLLGEPGTGKTAIVEGLAHRLLRGDVPESLRKVQIYSIDLASMIAGAGAQGEFEERLKGVIREVTASDGEIILFIDEIHLLVGAGQGSGGMDAANILKPELARGVMKTIGATTLDEHRKYIEKDKALERRFQRVTIDEPDIDSAISILRGMKSRLEGHHKVRILDQAIVHSVTLSDRYIADRFLPDKAIDLLDEAAAKMRLERESVPAELDLLERRIRQLEVEREALKREESPKTAEVEEALANLREKRNTLHAKWRNEKGIVEAIQQRRDKIEENRRLIEEKEAAGGYSEVVTLQEQIGVLKGEVAGLAEQLEEMQGDTSMVKAAVDEENIMEIVAAWTGIPVKQMTEDESARLVNLEAELHKRVVGQQEAIKAVANAIRRNRSGLSDPGKPIGSFIFLGTTGVGKTELCKALAEYLFHDPEMMVRLDMSEYQAEHSVSRLYGAPPGYVGFDQGGQLTEAVRRKPYSVVLLDEIEKAHKKVFETLLQVLDDGRMTDGQGRVVNFKNTIIIMTSNMGGAELWQRLGDENHTKQDVEWATQAVMNEMKRNMSPEFINRIDNIVMFLPLTREQIREIVGIQLRGLVKKQKANNMELSFSDAAVDFLAAAGYQPEYGARPVKRAISEFVIDELSMALLDGSLDRTRPITVEAAGERLAFSN